MGNGSAGNGRPLLPLGRRGGNGGGGDVSLDKDGWSST